MRTDINELAAVHEKITVARQPFDEQSQKVHEEATEALKDLHDELKAREAATLGPLQDDLFKAEEAFYKLLFAKNAQ